MGNKQYKKIRRVHCGYERDVIKTGIQTKNRTRAVAERIQTPVIMGKKSHTKVTESHINNNNKATPYSRDVIESFVKNQ